MQCIHLNKKAFALSIVLWIVAALLFGAATLALLAKDTFLLTEGVEAKLKTQLMVEDVLEAFKFYELTADFDNNSLINPNLNDFKYNFPTKMIVDGRWYKVGDNVELSITDASSLLNTMKTSSELIASIVGSDRQEIYTIGDSIKDWRDKDNIVSLNGAEASKYELQNSAQFKIRNSNSIQSVDEFRLINGIDKLTDSRWNDLKDRFFYGNGCVTNLSLIDSKYLSVLLHINTSKAESLIQEREINIDKFQTLIMKLKSYNDENNMGFHIAREFKIQIRSNIGLATSTLEAIIDFRRRQKRQYVVIKEVIR